MAKIVPRGNGYCIRYYEPLDANGNRKQRTISCKGLNKKQREQKLRDIETSLNAGNYVGPTTMTLAVFLRKWLAVQKEQLAPQTYERYAEMAERHVIPALGGIRLDKLRPLAIQEFSTKALESGRLDGKGGLAPKTVKNMLGMLHAALGQAVKWQLLATNAADAVDMPRVIRKEIVIASDEDMGKLLDMIDRSKYRMAILIVMVTGMRRGEVVGLKWEDFNPTAKTLTIRRSLTQVRGGVFEKEPKNGKARVVMIPDTLVSELQLHRHEQELTKELIGGEYVDEGWICSNPNGKRLAPKWLGNQFKRLAMSVGVEVALHGLRHTQATKLIVSGVPAKIVSERLGHSTVTITQDIYAHVMPHMQKQAADIMEEMFSARRAKTELQEN